MSAVVAWGAMTSIVISAYNFTGEKLSGAGQDDLDSYEYKQQLRKNRRRPVEQTIEEIGEGRGESIIITNSCIWLLTGEFQAFMGRVMRRGGRRY